MNFIEALIQKTKFQIKSFSKMLLKMLKIITVIHICSPTKIFDASLEDQITFNF